MSWDLLYETAGRSQRKRYQLSDQSRHSMALIAALGRWRQQHVTGQTGGGLTAEEITTVLRASLPLLQLPAYQGGLKLGVVGATALADQPGSATLMAHVSGSGAVRCVKERANEEAWMIGSVNTWVAGLLDGNREQMRIGGDRDFAEACLKSMHELLCGVPAEAAIPTDVGPR
jgi:hypothetical protein